MKLLKTTKLISFILLITVIAGCSSVSKKTGIEKLHEAYNAGLFAIIYDEKEVAKILLQVNFVDDSVEIYPQDVDNLSDMLDILHQDAHDYKMEVIAYNNDPAIRALSEERLYIINQIILHKGIDAEVISKINPITVTPPAAKRIMKNRLNILMFSTLPDDE